MNMHDGPTYSHRQHGRVHYLLAVVGAGLLALAVSFQSNEYAFIVVLATAAIVILSGMCVVWMEVAVDEEAVRARLGPIGLFRTTVRHEDIEGAEVARTTLLDGIGLHVMPWSSLTINVALGPCVRLALKRPRGLLRVRHVNIGTDDPEGLLAAIRPHLPGAAADDAVPTP